jgi:NTP pyrophosphatase (non-canonical NTP hydrolase)
MITEADLIAKIKEQLDWRGPGGKEMGVVVIPREMAEFALDWIQSIPAAVPVPERALMSLNDHAKRCHKLNDKWWRDPHTGERIERNKGELFMLMVTELCEAFEGERKDLMDSHLPQRKAVEVELADELIRLFDYAGKFKLDIDGAYWEKLAFNSTRSDHTFEARRQPGGKKW